MRLRAHVLIAMAAWMPIILSTRETTAQQAVAIYNPGPNSATLSDLIAYTGANKTGETVILKKGDATDDTIIPPRSSSRTYRLPDGVKLLIVSFLKNGKEIECQSQYGLAFCVPGIPQFAIFDDAGSGFDGKYAIAVAAPTDPLPPDDSQVTIEDGHIAGGQYQGITFYDVTTSDGDIEVDQSGVPTSPLLGGPFIFSTAFHVGVTIDCQTPARRSTWGYVKTIYR